MNTFPGMNQPQNPRQGQQAQAQPPLAEADQGILRPVDKSANPPIQAETQMASDVNAALRYTYLTKELSQGAGAYLEFQQIQDKETFNEILTSSLTKRLQDALDTIQSPLIGSNTPEQATIDINLLTSLINTVSADQDADELIQTLNEYLEDDDQNAFGFRTLLTIKAAIANSIQDAYNTVDNTLIKNDYQFLAALHDDDKKRLKKALKELGLGSLEDIQENESLLSTLSQIIALHGTEATDSTNGLKEMVEQIVKSVPNLTQIQIDAINKRKQGQLAEIYFLLQQSPVVETQIQTELTKINSLKTQALATNTELNAKQVELTTSKTALDTLVRDHQRALSTADTAGETTKKLQLKQTHVRQAQTNKETRLGALKDELSELEAKKDALDNAKDSHLQQSERLQTLEARYTQAKTAYDQRQSELKAELLELQTTDRKELEDKKDTWDRAQDSNLKEPAKLKTLEDRYNEAKAEYDKRQTDLIDAIAKLETEIKAHTDELNKLEFEIVDAEKLDTEGQDILNKRKEVDDLQNEIKEIKTKLDVENAATQTAITEYNATYQSTLVQADLENAGAPLDTAKLQALVEAQITAMPKSINVEAQEKIIAYNNEFPQKTPLEAHYFFQDNNTNKALVNAEDFLDLQNNELEATAESGKTVDLTPTQAAIKLHAQLLMAQNAELFGGAGAGAAEMQLQRPGFLDKCASIALAADNLRRKNQEFRRDFRSNKSYTQEQLLQDQDAQEKMQRYYPMSFQEAIVAIADSHYAQGAGDVYLRDDILQLAQVDDTKKLEQVFAKIKDPKKLFILISELNSIKDGTRMNVPQGKYLMYKSQADVAACSALSDAIIEYIIKLKTQELLEKYRKQTIKGDKKHNLNVFARMQDELRDAITEIHAAAFQGSLKDARYRVFEQVQDLIAQEERNVFGLKNPFKTANLQPKPSSRDKELAGKIDAHAARPYEALGQLTSRDARQRALIDVLSYPLTLVPRIPSAVGWSLRGGWNASKSFYRGSTSAVGSTYRAVLRTPGKIVRTVFMAPVHVIGSLFSKQK